MLKKILPLLAVLLVIVIAFTMLLGKSSLPMIPPELAKYSNDWPAANKDLRNTRESVSSSINAANVARLGASWSFPIMGVSEWGSAATNPLILGDKVYFQDLKSNVYAVNLNDGKQIWSKEYNLDVEGPSGVAVVYDKIFAVKGRFDIAALDLDGKELWSTTVSQNQNVGVDIQPSVYGGQVYISTVPGVSNTNFYKGGSIGTIYALEQKAGKITWQFDTVDSQDIWGNKEVNSGGGAWYPPAIDTASNTLFWGIGNPAPWPGTKDFPNGASRPGDNLYTNSMVALSQNTGKLVWFNQVKPHDLFDYDLQASPILANVKIGDKDTEVVIGAGKMGKVFAFDKATGKTIWSSMVGTHLNDNLTTLPAGKTSVSPGPLGGVETPMAYSDGIVYVPVVNMTVQYTPSEFIATSFDITKGKGELDAIEASTGKILWTNKLDSLNVGAATVVNDLVFTSTFNGKIYAFNKKTGAKVWEYQAPGGINGWPAVAGDTIVFPVGVGKTPMLLAFRLDGNLQIPGAVPIFGTGKGFQQ